VGDQLLRQAAGGRCAATRPGTDKPDPKPDPKPNPKPDPKPDPEPDPKPDPKPNPFAFDEKATVGVWEMMSGDFREIWSIRMMERSRSGTCVSRRASRSPSAGTPGGSTAWRSAPTASGWRREVMTRQSRSGTCVSPRASRSPYAGTRAGSTAWRSARTVSGWRRGILTRRSRSGTCVSRRASRSPIYAGAYAYGRRPVDPKGKFSANSACRPSVPMKQWKVLLFGPGAQADRRRGRAFDTAGLDEPQPLGNAQEHAERGIGQHAVGRRQDPRL
jgi:hypothetical protein